MTTYYVRKTGSDAAAGTSAGAAWLTIDKAQTVMTAGDTVYVGAGTYREEITVDTNAGTDGSPIRYVADVDGSQTSDAGLVVITAQDAPFENDETVARGSAFVVKKNFTEIEGFFLEGGGSRAIILNYTNLGVIEGIRIIGCSLIEGPGDRVALSLSTFTTDPPTTPTGDIGIEVEGCFVRGGLFFDLSGHATTEQDLKISVKNCTIWATADTAGTNSKGNRGVELGLRAGTINPGGVDITNCTFIGGTYGVHSEAALSTTYPINVRNCAFHGVENALARDTSHDGGITSDYNMFMQCVTPYTNVTSGVNDFNDIMIGGIGGMADLPLYRSLGWSPYLPWEPMQSQDLELANAMVGNADGTVAPATDMYGSPKPMGRGKTAMWVGHFDTFTVDTGGFWSSDANAFDGDILDPATPSTRATSDPTSGTGSSTNALTGTGTNANGSRTETITGVEVRPWYGTDTSAAFIQLEVSSGGVAIDNISTLTTNVGAHGTEGWDLLDVPSGGWDWSKVDGLVAKFWVVFDSGQVAYLYGMQVRVWYENSNVDDRGAVEARSRPIQETTTVQTGDNSIRFDGAGIHDFLLPVNAELTTVTIAGRFDANYTGSKPKLDVFNIPGVADQTDIMTGSSGAWEDMTASFTPDAKGIVRVRITSQDTSDTGKAFFDDLVIS